MKPILMSLAIAGALILTGCDTPALVSLDPIVTDEEATFDATLLGVWGTSDAKTLAVFRRDGDKAYKVTYVDDGSARQFSARLFRAGEARFLDIAPEVDDGFVIPGHALIRIWIEGAKLRWTFADTPWLAEQAGQTLANRKVGEKRVLLTAPASAIRTFLAAHGADEKAHDKIEEWQRAQ